MRPLAILFLTGCSIDSKIGNSISCGEGTELIDSECVPISEPDGPDDTGITEDTGTDIIEDADGDGWTEDEGDCDDDNDAVHPEAIEMCDEIDNDCDDEIDERDSEDARFFFRDNDGDTWGVDDDKIRACTPPEGYVDRAGDCDDTDPTIHPEAEEEWYDGIDSDCGEDSDFDADGDGHDTVDSGGDDCDDTDALVSPTADEVCDDDDIDEDCDGLSDDDDDSTLPESMTTWYLDLDGDGLGDMDDPGFAQCEEPFLVTEAVIDFEDMSSGAPTTEYSHLGATFTGSAHGVCAGLSGGDPGNWDLEGTAGPQFLGFNGGSYSDTISFDEAIHEFSLDVSRSNGSSDGDSFGLEALSGGSVVDSVTVTLPAVNTWLTVGFTDLSFDAVRMTGYGSAFHPYGVDNIIFGAASEDAGYVSTATDCDDDDPFIGADC